MSAPGPVNNGRLFEKDEPKRLRGNLRLKVDYIGVNACVWCGAKIFDWSPAFEVVVHARAWRRACDRPR